MKANDARSRAAAGRARELRCPVCQQPMRLIDRLDPPIGKLAVMVDLCEAHGIWLDRGELETIVRRRRRGRPRAGPPRDEYWQAFLQHVYGFGAGDDSAAPARTPER